MCRRYIELVRCLYFIRFIKYVKVIDIGGYFCVCVCCIGELCINRSVLGEMREFKYDF